MEMKNVSGKCKTWKFAYKYSSLSSNWSVAYIESFYYYIWSGRKKLRETRETRGSINAENDAALSLN